MFRVILESNLSLTALQKNPIVLIYFHNLKNGCPISEGQLLFMILFFMNQIIIVLGQANSLLWKRWECK